MFEHIKTTVEQGAVGMAAAIFQYQRLGFTVLVPLIDNQEYDLVVEKDEEFLRVQVKTTKYKRNEHYVVQVKTVRPNKTENKITTFGHGCDLLFVLCDNGDCYSIPRAEITTKNEVRLNKFESHKLRK